MAVRETNKQASRVILASHIASRQAELLKGRQEGNVGHTAVGDAFQPRQVERGQVRAAVRQMKCCLHKRIEAKGMVQQYVGE